MKLEHRALLFLGGMISFAVWDFYKRYIVFTFSQSSPLSENERKAIANMGFRRLKNECFDGHYYQYTFTKL